MATSGVGDFLDILDALLSTCMALVHAINTYYDPYTPYLLQVVETVLNVFFIVHFIENTYVAENKLIFAFSGSSFLEYATVLPSFFASISGYDSNEIVKLTRAFRFLCIYKLDKIFARRASEGSIFEI